MSEPAPRILAERRGPIHIVTLNRPEKLNAADLELQRQFLEAIEAVAADPEARALVIAGAGRAFCAGGDRALAEAAGQGRLPHKDELGRIQLGTILQMLGLSIPAIAAVHGPAVGYGASLAALCDVVVMGEGSFLSDPHVEYGIVASPPTLLVWPKLTSHAVARDLLMSGRRVGPEEAVRLGLATRTCAAGEELETALEVARGYLALPAAGVAATKRALNAALLREAEDLRFDADDADG
jgi:enoyl-CoA hydratase